MARVRHLSGRKWNKPPVLTAARRILIEALRGHIMSRPLGEMAEFVNGTSYRSDLLFEEGTPIIRISNITDPKSDFLKTKEPFEEKYKVEIGDLLVSWSASFKSIIWPGPPSILNQHIFRVRERSPNNRSFIRHAIEAVFDEMQQKVVGIGMMHLRRQDFVGHEIPCPSPEIQQAVSAYLDWIESGNDGKEPSLPKLLDHQRRIIARIEELTAKVSEAIRLQEEVTDQMDALCRAMITDPPDGLLTPTVMNELLVKRETDVKVEATTSYHFAGEYCFGRGVFAGQRKDGSEFAYRTLTRIRKGNFVYPKLMAWEGALGVVPENCDGLYVSPEFPVFEVREDRVLPELLDTYFRMPSVWPDLASISTGTNVRRRRLHPSAFLLYTFPLPSMNVQRQFCAVKRSVEQAKRVKSESAAELEALMPSILSKAFRGEL
jgi:hypothetical protein